MVRTRYEGRFFGRRVNCEQVPLLPGWAVAKVLEDPRKIPYSLAWKGRSSETVQETVRVTLCDEIGTIEISRGERSDFIRTVLRLLPRNGGSCRLLICPHCQIPRRGLYGWKPGGRFTTSVVRSSWACRACNGLRYASEGGALRERGRFARLFEATAGRRFHPERPEPWLPHIEPAPKLRGTSDRRSAR
jgi:hypothetical protein